MLFRFALFCLFFLSLSLTVSAQENSPLPPDGSSWFKASFGMLGYNWSQSLVIQGDTTISEQNYKKILNDNADYVSCLRSENDRWYRVNLNDTVEYLLYDFNLALGDTFWVNIPDPWDSYAPYLIVDSIDTVTLADNSERTRWILEYTNPDFESGPPYYGDAEWIQGIGSTMGLFNVLSCGGLDCGWSELICFNDDSQLIYEHEPLVLYSSGPGLPVTYTYENCSIFVSANEIDPISFSLYPNPSTDYIRVELLHSEQLNWIIFSMEGRRVLEGAFAPGETNHQISLSSLSSGMYVFQLRADSGRSSSKLLIKE